MIEKKQWSIKPPHFDDDLFAEYAVTLRLHASSAANAWLLFLAMPTNIGMTRQVLRKKGYRAVPLQFNVSRLVTAETNQTT